jgi:lipopolysaccharide/colanic/teichoic acid biosynthesis glycosyltransferase
MEDQNQVSRMAKSREGPEPAQNTDCRPGNGPRTWPHVNRPPVTRDRILNEKTFDATLTFERRRAERSRKPFVLMLVDSQGVHRNGNSSVFIERVTAAVSSATRETDIIGWYQEGVTLAVIFTEINLEAKASIPEALRSKVVTALRDNLDQEIASHLLITVHVFPENCDKDHPDRVTDIKLYPDLFQRGSRKRLPTIVKRGIDILGASLLLLILSPLLAVIALAIKLTSKGPVIFRQERVGQFGRKFKCLKFRTMYMHNDSKIHREFVRSFIAGAKLTEKNEGEPVVYKITNDPRITPLGRLLRRASFDEFPQFWNVLRGEMSLVGPRPPLPYEFEVYDLWHRRRVLEVKPGVTGLWQVHGRSRMCFDDMVRLDLRYSQRWSLWLDLKILLATPRAVFTGNGAV